MSNIDRDLCEGGACYELKEEDGLVHIKGAFAQAPGVATDTVEAWIKLRDAIQAGLLDHIGRSQ